MPLFQVIQDRLANDIATVIKSLDLQGTPDVTGSIGDRVLTQVVPEKLSVASGGLPAIIVETTRRPTQEGDGGNFEERFVVYRVRCWVMDEFRTNYQQCQSDYAFWLHQLGAYFDGLVTYYPTGGLFKNVPECHDVRPQDQIVLDGDAARESLAKGYIDLDCHTNEKRWRNSV